MFPTLGVGMEEALLDDIEAAHAAFHGLQRAGSTRTGASTTDDRIFAAPDAVRCSTRARRWRSWTGRSRAAPASSCMRAGPIMHADRRPVPGRPGLRPVLGAWSTTPASPSPTTRASPATAATRSTGASRRRSRPSGADAVHGVLTDRPADLRHDGRAGLPRPVRPLPEPAGGDHRERQSTWVPDAAREAGKKVVRPDPGSVRRRTRSRPSAATSGCRRTTRTTSRAWPSTSAPTTSCSARTGPTPRAWPTPPTTSTTSRASTRPTSGGSCTTTPRLVTPRVPAAV